MITVVKNIVKANANSFTSSKWNDAIVSNFDTGVKQQLCGYTEI
jgi:hypothetical protein